MTQAPGHDVAPPTDLVTRSEPAAPIEPASPARSQVERDAPGGLAAAADGPSSRDAPRSSPEHEPTSSALPPAVHDASASASLRAAPARDAVIASGESIDRAVSSRDAPTDSRAAPPPSRVGSDASVASRSRAAPAASVTSDATAARDAPAFAPARDARARAPAISAAARWTIVVFAPAVGSFAGMMLAARAAIELRFGTFVVLTVAGGALGAVGALVTALLLAPHAAGGEDASPDELPRASQPSWAWQALLATLAGLIVGAPLGRFVAERPALMALAWTAFALLIPVTLVIASRARRAPLRPDAALGGAYALGLGGGLGLAPFIHDRAAAMYSGFTTPWGSARALLLAVAAGVALLLLEAPRGAPAIPAGHAPVHRLVARALLRAVACGLVAGLMSAVAIAPISLGAHMRVLGQDGALVALVAFVAAASATVVEALAWRWGRLRWPLLVLGALAVPVVAFVGVRFVEQLSAGREPIDALRAILDEVAAEAGRSGRRRVALAWLSAGVPPFVLLTAARTGALPYLGARAPWPLHALVPLAALAGVTLLATARVLGPDHGSPRSVLFVAAGLVGLVVALRACEPLERRLVSRWRRVTAGGDA